MKTKAQLWEENNREKRRIQCRLRKRRVRALERSAVHGSPLWQRLQRKKARDRNYSRRRYLMGLQKPSEITMLHLDAPYGSETLHEVLPSGLMSPLEYLMLKEDFLKNLKNII